MTVESIQTIGVETAGPDTTVEVLVATMAEKDVGSVVVVEDDRPVGIVTDRDLLLRVYGEMLDPTQVTAADVMSHDPVTVSVDADVLEASRLMRRNEVRRLPVVDDQGAIAGILALDDVLRLLGTELHNLTRVVEAES